MNAAVWDARAVLELYERGLYLQALQLGTRSLPLEQWPGTEGRLLAGRLARNLGAERQGLAWHARAWRADPQHPQACLYYAHVLCQRRGPLVAWDFVERQDGTQAFDAPTRAEWHALRAHLLALFRDFERAEEELLQARATAVVDPWIEVEHSCVLQAADDYPAALAAVRRALELQPWFRPAVQHCAELLQLSDRTDEAIAFLQQALGQLESHAVAGQLAVLLRERERWEEAERALDVCERLAPLADKAHRRGVVALRSNLASMRGDDARALELARLVETTFHSRVERMVARPPASARKLLPVVFVRQHHMTCGPATLTALWRWFGHQAEQLEIAERICYGGTSAYSERSWAEQRGFLVREFTLTARNAQQLVDRGLPCGVETQESTSGHMQALIGYDDRRETLLVRDPYQPFVGEWPIQEFFERYRASGPRAVLFLPRERAAELEGLELDDQDLHDRLYRVEAALRVHDHARALAEAHALEELAPDHLLTLGALRAICAYEQDSLGLLALTSRLCEIFPDCDRYLLFRLALLRELARKEERVALLRERARRPRCDPALLLQLASELSEDARTRPEAERLLRETQRRAPLSTQGLWLRSRLFWERGERERAIESARFAACLEDTDEGLASSYFSCCVGAGRTAEALNFLRSRQARFTRLSSQPAQGLFSALERLARSHEAFELLEQALVSRPDDVGLALFAAAAHARYGRLERARSLVEQAAPRAPRRSVLQIQAEIEVHAGAPARALECWRELLASEPLDVRARERCLGLVRSTAGPRQQAAEALELAARYPFHAPLQRLCIELLEEDHAQQAIELLQALLARHPEDAWAQRELALHLTGRGELETALRSAEEGCAIEPRTPASHLVHGSVLRAMGRTQEATRAWRRAVELDVDVEEAVARFVSLSSESGEGQNALALVRSELGRQATNGRGIAAWAFAARGRLAPARILETLRALRDLHQDLWLAHLCLVRELLANAEAQKALARIEEATARFPLHARLWSLRAAVHAQLHDDAAAQQAAEQACALDPNSPEALHMLARARLGKGERQAARELFERAAAGAPLAPLCHEELVQALLQMGAKAEALERAELAVRLLPREAAAWRLHASAARANGCPQRTLERLAALARESEREAHPWLMMAAVLDPRSEASLRATALRRALEIEPQCYPAVDQLCEQLVFGGEIAEAQAVLERFQPGPTQLAWIAGRKAWVLGESGARKEAVRLLEELVRANPQYAWARSQLTRYYRELGDNKAYRDSAALELEIDPDDPAAAEQLAHANLQLGLKDEAQKRLHLLLELHPERSWAARQLLGLQLEAQRFAEARETLERASTSLSPAARGAFQMQIHCGLKEFGPAFELLRELCAIPELEPDGLEHAVAALAQQGRSEDVRRELERLILERGATPALGAAWMDAVILSEGWTVAVNRLLKLAPDSAAAGAAARQLTLRAHHRREVSVFPKLIRRCEALLRSNVDCYGNVAAYLLGQGKYADVIRWCEDWQRIGAPPWLLYNLAYALLWQGRSAEAEKVLKHALALPPDPTTPELQQLMACAALLQGDVARARTHQARALEQPSNPIERRLRALVAVPLKQLSGPDPGSAFELARAQLRELRPARPRALRAPGLPTRVYRASVRAVARQRGGFWAKAWSLFARL